MLTALAISQPEGCQAKTCWVECKITCEYLGVHPLFFGYLRFRAAHSLHTTAHQMSYRVRRHLQSVYKTVFRDRRRNCVQSKSLEQSFFADLSPGIKCTKSPLRSHLVLSKSLRHH